VPFKLDVLGKYQTTANSLKITCNCEQARGAISVSSEGGESQMTKGADKVEGAQPPPQPRQLAPWLKHRQWLTGSR